MANEKWRQELRDLVEVWVSGNDFVKESAYVGFLAEINKAYKRGEIAGKSKAGYATRRNPKEGT